MSNKVNTKIKAVELKRKFLEYFGTQGHTEIPNSSLIPQNDPSAIFINSGMHPLIPYLLGESHPYGNTKRLMNVQRCIRTVDIDNIGDSLRHITFFEMLGEWSLGDYWKKESLHFSIEFLVDILGFDINRLYATVYRGDDIVPRDDEAIEIWKEIFSRYDIEPTIGEDFTMQNCPRIILLGDDNFWTVGGYGPCGPTSEIFYDRGYGQDTDTKYLEVVNNVFMAYYLSKEGSLTKLEQQNIDVGWGLERLLLTIWNMEENGDIPLDASVFDTDSFITQRDIILQSLNKTVSQYKKDLKLRKTVRLLLDHIRASLIIIADGVEPSNKDQGYVLRRLIRRAVTYGKLSDIDINIYNQVIKSFIMKLSEDNSYKQLLTDNSKILAVFDNEVTKFNKILSDGIKIIDKIKTKTISGELAFRLKEANGMPIEILSAIAEKRDLQIEVDKYNQLMKDHQDKSRNSTKGKFVGGLGDHSNEAIAYHTVAHLLLAQLRLTFGTTVVQKGQNITGERLRYDFAFTRALSIDEIRDLEKKLNDLIEKNLKVDMIEVSYEKSKEMGVIGMFHEKYKDKDTVKLYRIYSSDLDPDTTSNLFSIEYCGGPHVNNTSEILNYGKVKILKEEASGSGVRRIKIAFDPK